tara:strand:+ start:275 stop:1036 length:762 start_codon:yes stop_codon:yes gene_type:complete
MKKKKKILIFIISYKASYRILDVYNQIPFKKLKRFEISVLVSDDCSNDDTAKYIKKINKNKIFVNINKYNMGYGSHIKKCLDFALKKNFDYAVMIHGDGQYHPKYIPKLLSLISKKNSKSIGAVTGSRLLKGLNSVKQGGMPIYKMIGNIFLTKIFNILFNSNFTDAHTGLWTYDLNFLKDRKYKLLADNFNFDQDFRYLCMNKKMKIKEIFIRTKYGDERSQLHVIYAIRFFFNSLIFFLIDKKILKSKKFV